MKGVCILNIGCLLILVSNCFDVVEVFVFSGCLVIIVIDVLGIGSNVMGVCSEGLMWLVNFIFLVSVLWVIFVSIGLGDGVLVFVLCCVDDWNWVVN